MKAGLIGKWQIGIRNTTMLASDLGLAERDDWAHTYPLLRFRPWSDFPQPGVL